MAIARIKSWVDGETLTASDLNIEVDNITDQLPPIASQAEVTAMTETTKALSPNHNKIILGTQQASTSGTTVTFSSIPAGVRRITINLVGVSTSGTSDLMIQIGDSGGLENSGYLGAATTIVSATPATLNLTIGFALTETIAAASVIHGTVTLTLENSTTFTWVCSSILASSNTAATHIGAGSKSLTAELTQLAISAQNGADTFDAGAINITYER
jgi:hypothetical protein